MDVAGVLCDVEEGGLEAEEVDEGGGGAAVLEGGEEAEPPFVKRDFTAASNRLFIYA